MTKKDKKDKDKQGEPVRRDVQIEDEIWKYVDSLFRTNAQAMISFAGADNWTEKMQQYIESMFKEEEEMMDLSLIHI